MTVTPFAFASRCTRYDEGIGRGHDREPQYAGSGEDDVDVFPFVEGRVIHARGKCFLACGGA
jgi:hypothetical protein